MNDINIAELRALSDAATPGPWSLDYRGDVVAQRPAPKTHVWMDNTIEVITSDVEIAVDDDDARLIVAAANTLPALLDRIEGLEAAVARVGALHVRSTPPIGRDWCKACMNHYPCPTKRAQDGEDKSNG